MATVKELIDDVISQLTGDGADALKEKLREAKVQFGRVEESLSDANKESKNRKEEIRELKAKQESFDSEIEKYKNLNPELDRLKAIEAKYNAKLQKDYTGKANTWKGKAEIFAIPETDNRHAKIAKVKDKFIFPADDKTALTDEQIDANLRAYDLLEMAGYFETDNNLQPALPHPVNRMPDKLPDKLQAAVNLGKGKL
jgi:hypothetical protein